MPAQYERLNRKQQCLNPQQHGMYDPDRIDHVEGKASKKS